MDEAKSSVCTFREENGDLKNSAIGFLNIGG